MFLAVRQLPEGVHFVYLLSIISVSRSDGGLYSCQVLANSDLSEIARDVVSIDVHYFPTSVSCQQPHATSAYRASELVALNCTTEVSNPVVDVQWMNSAIPNEDTIMPSSLKVDRRSGIVYSVFTFRPTIENNGAVFFCKISSPLFPQQTLSCHIGPLSVSGGNNVLNLPTSSSPSTGTTIPSNHVKIKTTSKTAIQCQNTCSAMSSSIKFWIVGAVFCSLAAVLFLIICLLLLLRISQFSSSDNDDDNENVNPGDGIYTTGQLTQLSDDMYAQLGGRLETTGSPRLYMTLERPYKGNKINDDVSHMSRNGLIQCLVPVSPPHQL